MDLPEAKLYTISQAGKILGVSPKTLKRWEKSGKIKIPRTPTGNRFFTKESLEALKNNLGLSQESAKIEITRPKTFHFPTLLKPSPKFSFITAVLIVSILANFFLFSKTDYPHQAVLGVETFVAPALEESAPLGNILSLGGKFIGGLTGIFKGGSLVVPLLGKSELETPADLNVQGKAHVASDIEGLGNLKIQGTASVGKLVTQVIDPYLIENDGTVQNTLEIRSTGNIKLEPGTSNIDLTNSSLTNLKNITSTGGISSGSITINGNTTLGSKTSNTLTINPATLTFTGGDKILDVTGDTTMNLTILNSTASQVVNVNLSDGSLQTNGTTRLDNSGNLTNIGTIGAGAITSTSLNTGSGAITTTGTITGGIINATTKFQLNGTDGKTVSACGSSQYLGGIAVTGGIITTLGSCTTVSSSWSGLTDPSANLSLNMAAYTTTFTWNAATSTGNLFKLIDTTNNTGTGYLMDIETASGSNLKPLTVVARGNAIIDTTAAGVLTLGNSTLAQNIQFFSSSNTITSGGALTLAGGITTSGNLTFSNAATVSLASSSTTALNFQSGLLDLDTTNSRIGIGTASPGYKLDVRDATNNGIAIYGKMLATVNSGNFAVQGENDSTAGTAYGVAGYALGAATTNIAGYFDAAGAGTNYGLIVNRGNVGIGTTSPGYKLDIKPTTNVGQLFLEQNNTADGWKFFAESAAGDLTFSSTSGGGSSAVERIRFTNAGNLVFATDNSQDIGASGATRPRTEYLGTALAIGTNPAGGDGAGYKINLANSGFIGVRNAANLQDYDVIGFDSTDTLFIGGGWHRNVGTIKFGANFTAQIDNTYDIGASAANRPRSIYLGTLTAASATTVCRDANGGLSTCSSSGKFKTNIDYLSDSQLSDILGQITDSKLASFNFTTDPYPNLKRFGIIAEEAPTPLQYVDQNGNNNLDFYSAQLGYTWAGIKALNQKLATDEAKLVNLESSNKNLLTTVGLPTPTPSASPTPTPLPSSGQATQSASILSRLDSLEKSVLSLSVYTEASRSASFDTLSVLKKLTTTDLGITGKLTQGLLSINGLDNTVASGSATINTISNDLYLQNLGVGGVNFVNSKVLIDKNGNLKLDGGILAIKGSSVGSAVLPAGTTSLDITTSVATSTSKIFVTANSKTGKQPLLVTNKSAGKFTVSIEDPYTEDIPFDWWIIETQ